jgi:hypothetical protein
MTNTGTSTSNAARFPRAMFIVALMVTLGAAVAVLQTSMPVREAFGLEPIIDGLPPRTLWTLDLPDGSSDGDPVWLASVAAHSRDESTIVRTFGTGTQRARLLPLTEFSPAQAGRSTNDATESLPPVVAAVDRVESYDSFAE